MDRRKRAYQVRGGAQKKQPGQGVHGLFSRVCAAWRRRLSTCSLALSAAISAATAAVSAPATVSTTTAAVATAAAATAISAAATTARARRAFTGFVHRQRPPLEVVSVQGLDGRLHVLLGFHLHKAEAARAARLPILDHL